MFTWSRGSITKGTIFPSLDNICFHRASYLSKRILKFAPAKRNAPVSYRSNRNRNEHADCSLRMSDRRRRTPGGAPTGFNTTGNRTALGYWIPLAATVTVAAVGLVAWVWSERHDDNGDGWYDDDDDDESEGDGITLDPGADSRERAIGAEEEDAGMVSRMQGALRRTPSPQQIFDGASKRVTAGVTAAGAAFGGALTSIREEGNGNGDFEEHSRWAEASRAMVDDGSRPRSDDRYTMSGALLGQSPKKKRQSVAVVVSSVSANSDSISEHASLLSQLPEYVEPELAQVFVLIYSPGVQSPPVGASLGSITSSYDNIAPDEARAADSGESPELAAIGPQATQDGFDSATPQFRTLFNQAQVLVDKDSMIMPFNTPNGHVHILRHLSPDTVYVEESLTGDNGETVQNISGWVRQVVVVANDSDTTEERWWQTAAVGPGKRVDVVDQAQTGDDWRKRICGRD